MLEVKGSKNIMVGCIGALMGSSWSQYQAAVEGKGRRSESDKDFIRTMIEFRMLSGV